MIGKRLVLPGLFCALALTLPSLSGTASAAEASTVHTSLWTGRLYVNETFAGFQNEQGRPVDAISYEGTVYIPIRNAGEWMGCTVSWDQAAQSIRMTSGGTPSITASKDLPDSTPEELALYGEQVRSGITITLRPDITVYLDGEAQQFTNVSGVPVYPISFQDVTYLPVRSVAELCGLDVVWLPQDDIGGRSYIFLYTPLTDAQKSEISDYTLRVSTLFDQLDTAVNSYLSSADLTKEDALARLEVMSGYVQQIAQAQVTTPVMQYYRKTIAKIASSLTDFGAIADDMQWLNNGVAFQDLNSTEFFSLNMDTLRYSLTDLRAMTAALGL